MRIFISLIFFVLFTSCQNNEEILIYNESGKLIEKFIIDKDSVRNGEYLAYYDDGSLKESSFFKDGVLDGERILYFKNGQNEIVENYVEGQMNGPYVVYYANGAPLLKQTFKMDTLIGESFKYYESGQLEEKVVFVDNLENGPFEEYYENGQLHWTGTYLNGDNEYGLLSEYDESGQLIKKMECDSYAICRTIWTIEDGDIEPKY